MPAPLPVAYLDGEFQPLATARISPLDRGFLFGEGVYEVLPVYGGRPLRFAKHCARLERSLAAIRLESPYTRPEWAALVTELIARNGGGDQYVYLHVTRGAEEGRNHAIPTGLVPTVFAMATPLLAPDPALLTAGVAAITTADLRWRRCDIKSTALLANVLAKTLATDAGATEAILLDGGELREGSSSSVLVVAGGELFAPPDSPAILPGTTRDLAFELAAEAGIAVRIGPVSEAQLRAAEEILLAFATRGVLPVTRLDGVPVGSGLPGPVWRRLFDRFVAYRDALAGQPLLVD